MEFAVKRFARNILLIHLVLLLVVLALVLLASNAIRNSAQAQAQQQAEIRQRMLATQTARGIEAFYDAIVSVMDLDQPDKESDGKALVGEVTREMSANPAPTTHPTTHPTKPPIRQGIKSPEPAPRANTRPPRRRMVVGQLLALQLRERVTHLFVVNVSRDPKSPKDAKDPLLDLSIQDKIKEPRKGEGTETQQIFDQYHDWLLEVARESRRIGPETRDSKGLTAELPEQAVSGFQLIEGRGYNLVAMPVVRRPQPVSMLVVAAIPVSTITEQFLSTLNNDPATGSLLLNDSQTVMASSRKEIVGAMVQSQAESDIEQSLQTFRTQNYKSAIVVDHPFKIAGATFEPSMLTAEPIEVGKRKWLLVVASPLSEVDAVVAQVFGRLVIWAVVVVLAITAVLVSTAVQMIRGRLRLERFRTEAIRAELDRARQIQQAWLPRAAPACSAIDIAAVNFPAHHISGDFYNWFSLPDGRIAVVIGDVTGHGMSAAFLMATTQLLVRTTMQRITDPAACLEEVNRQLCTLVFNGQFVTLLLMVLDPAGGPVEICSAGHPAPLLATTAGRSNTFVPLDLESGLVLGVDPDAAYQTTTSEALPGAALLLYTDGAIDAQSPKGARLGNEGLRNACPDRLSLTPRCGDAQAMLDGVVRVINDFRGSRELGDDLTFVAIRLTQAQPAPERELAGVA